MQIQIFYLKFNFCETPLCWLWFTLRTPNSKLSTTLFFIDNISSIHIEKNSQIVNWQISNLILFFRTIQRNAVEPKISANWDQPISTLNSQNLFAHYPRVYLFMFVAELVSGLLCCSAPPYNAREWSGHHHHQAPGHSVTSAASVPDMNTDPRTLDWVMRQQGDRCRLGQCGGQDCGDGFCVNVWNNMVHV